MIPILEDLRFDRVSRLSCINIDWRLITALMERWRPETYFFHLPVGECTVTFQDVGVLLGLRIDGDVITGNTGGVDSGWANLVEHIFGKRPKEEDKELKGGQVHCMYIPLIQDFDRCKSLAWGAAVLAYLFRELCKSCRGGVEEMVGCVLLLQLWAWTRLPFLAHVHRGPVLETLDNPLWCDHTGPNGM
ncbi:hypothetical protein AgCh_018518 [Apium graveolens]